MNSEIQERMHNHFTCVYLLALIRFNNIEEDQSAVYFQFLISTKLKTKKQKRKYCNAQNGFTQRPES